jgi:hypothetical protein
MSNQCSEAAVHDGGTFRDGIQGTGSGYRATEASPGVVNSLLPPGLLTAGTRSVAIKGAWSFQMPDAKFASMTRPDA